LLYLPCLELCLALLLRFALQAHRLLGIEAATAGEV
jgi:hypothetical protein